MFRKNAQVLRNSILSGKRSQAKAFIAQVGAYVAKYQNCFATPTGYVLYQYMGKLEQAHQSGLYYKKTKSVQKGR